MLFPASSSTKIKALRRKQGNIHQRAFNKYLLKINKEKKRNIDRNFADSSKKNTHDLPEKMTLNQNEEEMENRFEYAERSLRQIDIVV